MLRVHSKMTLSEFVQRYFRRESVSEREIPGLYRWEEYQPPKVGEEYTAERFAETVLILVTGDSSVRFKDLVGER